MSDLRGSFLRKAEEIQKRVQNSKIHLNIPEAIKSYVKKLGGAAYAGEFFESLQFNESQKSDLGG